MPATNTNSAKGLVPVTGTIATGSAASWTANGWSSPAGSAAGAGRGGSGAAGLPPVAGDEARRGPIGSRRSAAVAARRTGRGETEPATGVGTAPVDGVPRLSGRGSLSGWPPRSPGPDDAGGEAVGLAGGLTEGDSDGDTDTDTEGCGVDAGEAVANGEGSGVRAAGPAVTSTGVEARRAPTTQLGRIDNDTEPRRKRTSAA